MYLLRTYVFSDLKGEEVGGTFYEKELQKTYQNQKVYSWKNNKEKKW